MKRPLRTVSLAALTLLLVCKVWSTVAWPYENTDADVQRVSQLTLDFETPHTRWARPYAGGSLRGYYFVGSTSQGMQTHAREAVELMQRFDIQLDASFYFNFYGQNWFGGAAGHRRISRLMQRPHHVYIFQDVSPAQLPDWPDDPKKRFLENVSQGAAVVLIGTDDGGLFPNKKPLGEIPALLMDIPEVQVFNFGKGRIVQLPARPKIPYRVGWHVAYDYWQEQVGRTVLWATRREPQTQLELLADEEIPRQRLPAKVITLSWQGATAAQVCDVRLRRWDGRQVDLGRIVCRDAKGQAIVELPRVQGGRYFVEAFLINTGRQGRQPNASYRSVVLTDFVKNPTIFRGSSTEVPDSNTPSDRHRPESIAAWTTASVTVTPDTTVQEIEFKYHHDIPRVVVGRDQPQRDERLGVHTPFVELGEPIEGEVKLTGPTRGRQLSVRLLDRRDRILARRDTPAAATCPFRFTAEPWMPQLVRLQAIVLDGGDEVASDYRYHRITRRHRGRFHFVLWGFPVDENLAPYAVERLSQMGVTAFVDRFPPPLLAAEYNMGWVPWTGGQLTGNRADQWPDPEFANYWISHTGRSRPHGVLVYSLGDEGAVAGYGTGPASDAAFREYLQTVYGEMENLNRSWDTKYRGFDEIRIAETAELGKAAADAMAGVENHVPAYDLYAFGGYNFVQLGKRWTQRLRADRNDPQAVIGFEGSGGLARRMQGDPELICRELGMWVPYAGPADEFVRSIAPREFLRSNWMGYHQDAEGHLGRYWRAVVNGSDSVWYWMWSNIGAWQGFQRPDLGGGEPAIEEFLQDTQIVRDGLGDLLLHYDIVDDRIAMLYSHPTKFVSEQTERNRSYGAYWWSLSTWQTVIQDLGFQFRYVTGRMLHGGDSDLRGCKVLVLPQALAISPETAQVIREFARQGGTVIADVPPAVYNQHGKQHKQPLLDDLFGVRTQRQPARQAALKIDAQFGDSQFELIRPEPEHEAQAVIDPGTRLAGGTALGTAGDVPVGIVNRFGKGTAILLNFAPASTFTARGDTPNLSGHTAAVTMPPNVGKFFLNLFASTGVERRIGLVPYKNKQKLPFLGNVKVQRWRNGEYEIVTFFREASTGASQEARYGAVTRHGDTAAWVYDIRNRVTVGETNFWITDIRTARPTWFAVLPKALPNPEISLPKSARCGQPVTATIRVPGAAGLHALQLRATTPDGKNADFWKQTILVDGKPTHVKLPLAHNDPTGTWTITLTDLFSPETQQSVELLVEEPR